jgi:hypothetical protein
MQSAKHSNLRRIGGVRFGGEWRFKNATPNNLGSSRFNARTKPATGVSAFHQRSSV